MAGAVMPNWFSAAAVTMDSVDESSPGPMMGTVRDAVPSALEAMGASGDAVSPASFSGRSLVVAVRSLPVATLSDMAGALAEGLVDDVPDVLFLAVVLVDIGAWKEDGLCGLWCLAKIDFVELTMADA